MRAAEVKSLVAPQGAVHPYRVEVMSELTFFFPPALWGAAVTRHDVADRVIMVRTEGRGAQFLVRVRPRTMDTTQRNVGFHVTNGMDCWYVEVRYNRRGEYLTHETRYVPKKPHELGLVRATAIIRPEGRSREEQLWLRDYGSTVVIQGSAGFIFEKVTNGGVEITSRCGYPFATLTGPWAGRACQTIRISDTNAGRSWGMTVHFNQLYERYELPE